MAATPARAAGAPTVQLQRAPLSVWTSSVAERQVEWAAKRSRLYEDLDKLQRGGGTVWRDESVSGAGSENVTIVFGASSHDRSLSEPWLPSQRAVEARSTIPAGVPPPTHTADSPEVLDVSSLEVEDVYAPLHRPASSPDMRWIGHRGVS
jgi:hypothetical protein